MGTRKRTIGRKYGPLLKNSSPPVSLKGQSDSERLSYYDNASVFSYFVDGKRCCMLYCAVGVIDHGLTLLLSTKVVP